jgi:predicted RNA-binding Zn ribbon-like protein
MSSDPLINRFANLPISHMGLLGGSLCLDFVNTLAWRTSNSPDDRLQTLDDLLAWSIYVGLLSPDDVKVLYQKSQKDKVSAKQALEQALLLRESIHRIFSAILVGKIPDGIDITTLREIFAEAILHADLVNVGKKYDWQIPTQANDVRVIYWSVAISAVGLITSEELGRMRVCQNEGCGYLFVDRTRNGSRLWCTSDVCGNRARVRRFYDKYREKNK